MLCMHGLTRNAADFEDVCENLPTGVRAIAVDQRGRARSEYDPNPGNYLPASYVQDMFTLIDHLGLERVVLFGTSLGGLMAMMMNAMKPGFFKGVILNDIGPVINPEGLDRIKGYVGKGEPMASWEEAAELLKANNKSSRDALANDGWMRFAKRTCEETEDGRVRLAYDPKISEPIGDDEENAVPPDLWPVFDQLQDVPLLVIRGELSDILHPDTVAGMQRRKPDMEVLEVPGVGHAPILDEPGVMEKVSAFVKAL
ncbi:MAG: alpha/beta hydrolase [Gammaproteobacteria bacterium]|nr:alpha/beta hydrolase [Gammaproteobacteria bacterium]